MIKTKTISTSDGIKRFDDDPENGDSVEKKFQDIETSPRQTSYLEYTLQGPNSVPCRPIGNGDFCITNSGTNCGFLLGLG